MVGEWGEGAFVDDRGEGASNDFYIPHSHNDPGPSYAAGGSGDGEWGGRGARMSTSGSSSSSIGNLSNTAGAANSSGASPYTTGARGPKPYVCDNCRNRKLKCDRKFPCSRCVRGKVNCTYPLNHFRSSSNSASGSGAAGASAGSGLIDARTGSPHQQGNGRGNGRRTSHQGGKLARQYVEDSGATLALMQRHQNEALSIFRRGSSDSYRAPSILLPNALSPSFADNTWHDHLISFFGANRQTALRTIVFLIQRVAPTIEHEHWFQICHIPTVVRAVTRPEESSGVSPAVVFSLVATALRTYNRQATPNSLMAVEAVPGPTSENDLSEQIRICAETYLDQTMTSAAASSDGLSASGWLGAAQAASLLLRLHPEFSARGFDLMRLAVHVARMPRLQEALEIESQKTNAISFDGPLFGKVGKDVARSDVRIEEAARMRLFPMWIAMRIGYAYPNIELPQSRFQPDEMKGAKIFTMWPDEAARPSSDLFKNAETRTRGLSVLSKCMSSWHLPASIDYSDPPDKFQQLLRLIDDCDFLIDVVYEIINWAEPTPSRLTFAKFVNCAAHLQGIVIRRTGVAHHADLHDDIITALQKRQASPDLEGARGISPSSSTSPSSTGSSTVQTATTSSAESIGTGAGGQKGGQPWQKNFNSAIFRAWNSICETYMTELEVDYLAATRGTSPINISKFQLDSASLYVAASNQYAQGVIGTYRLLGHPDPESNSTARELLDVAQNLGSLIKRHRDLMGEHQTIMLNHQAQQPQQYYHHHHHHQNPTQFAMDTTSTTSTSSSAASLMLMDPVLIQP